MRGLRWIIPILLTPAPAIAADQDPQDLNNLSIEELAQLPVQSASKQAEPLNAVPNSIYVITADDIHRSTAQSLPEVLRDAPNLQVERINATQYAISARGFNGYNAANKLLVLIDGRTIYSTLHSGVFWDLHNPMLEDLQQIDVVSGPGGTLYGPNAVNGVINITSKSAFDTQGLLLRGSGGDQERTAGARYGVKLGDSAALRVYGNWHVVTIIPVAVDAQRGAVAELRVYGNWYDRDDMPASGTTSIDDAIRGWQAGFRADAREAADSFTLQGDIFHSDRSSGPDDGDLGRNVLGRWTHALTPKSSFQIQAYYDYYQRRELGVLDRLETFDVETQYNLKTGVHSIVAGAGVRTTNDLYLADITAARLDPASARLWIGNGFVQDRIALSPQVAVIAGVKLEGATYSGLQVLPNLRLAWQPSDATTLWAAVSRAVRTPSRMDRDLVQPGSFERPVSFISEKLIAFEAGYRGKISPTTTLSISTYFNLYDDLRTADVLGGKPARIGNDLYGHTYGVEAWATEQFTPWWRMSAGASWLGKNFRLHSTGAAISADAAAGQDPDYQLSLRSQFTLPHGVRIDLGLRDVGGLKNPDTPAYAEGDARIGWDVSRNIELYVAGDNLLHGSHLESNEVGRAQRISRSVYAGARLRF